MGWRAAALLPSLQTKLEGNREFGGVSAPDELPWGWAVPSSGVCPEAAGTALPNITKRWSHLGLG